MHYFVIIRNCKIKSQFQTQALLRKPPSCISSCCSSSTAGHLALNSLFLNYILDLNNLMLWSFLFCSSTCSYQSHYPHAPPMGSVNLLSKCRTRDTWSLLVPLGPSRSLGSLASHRQLEQELHLSSLPNSQHQSLLSHPCSCSCQTFINHDKGLEHRWNIIISPSPCRSK